MCWLCGYFLDTASRLRWRGHVEMPRKGHFKRGWKLGGETEELVYVFMDEPVITKELEELCPVSYETECKWEPVPVADDAEAKASLFKMK